jgi:signal transduction histidine kinase
MLDAVGDFLSRGSTEQAREILDKALSRTRTTIGELRDLSFNLEPVVLRDHGFGMAVNALAQEKGLTHKMKIELDVGAAEALDGAIRRGPPETFSVLIEPEQETLSVTIRDDAPSERRRRSIEVLEERARTLGAVISVDHDEHGSTMRLVLPMYAASK